MSVSCELNQLPNCCGCYEAGYFREGSGTWGEYKSANWSEMLGLVLDISHGQPLFFNFVRPLEDEDYEAEEWQDEYEAAELRELIMKHPNAKHIGCFKNKNSGNIVDSWYIYNCEDMSNA